MKNKTTYSLGIVLLAALLGLILGVMFAPKLDARYWKRNSMENAMSARVNTMMTLVDNFYVDKIDYDSLTDKMMNAMLSTLDPHSCYLSPTAFEQEAEMVQGRFEGIGLTLYYLGDTVYGSTIIPGSPAERAGLHPGDRIIKVDTTVVSGRGLTKDPKQVVDLIRGPRHSTVTLGIQRRGSEKIEYVKVQRNIIRHSSIPAAVMLDKETGYIFVSRFAENTADEFHTALETLTKSGMKHLVLDLRGNGGGVLDGAIKMADELLPKGELIVYTQGAHDRRRNVYATKGGLYEQGRLTVLINEHSASASEVVSGAIQDNDRGAIIGHRSFGKGLVQRQFDLPGNSAMLLTIARYHSPSGRCIQRPYDKGSDDYYMQYLTRVLSDYNAADSLLSQVDTSQSFLTTHGRKVYGGGGIQPDVTLPYLRDVHLVYYNELINKQVLEIIIYDKLFKHYDELMKQYPSLEAYEKNFHVDDATWQAILRLSDKLGLKRDEACLAKYGNEIRTRFKGILAQSLYGEGAYYKIVMPTDVELQMAIKAKVKLTK